MISLGRARFAPHGSFAGPPWGVFSSQSATVIELKDRPNLNQAARCQSRTQLRLSEEDIQEGIENLRGFFTLLRAWARTGERDCTAHNNHEELAALAAVAAAHSATPYERNDVRVGEALKRRGI